jgi:hypothetical protein
MRRWHFRMRRASRAPRVPKASTAMHAEAEIGLIRQDAPSWPGHPHSRAGMTVLSHKRL